MTASHTLRNGKALFFAEIRAWLNAASDSALLGDALAIRQHRRRLTSDAEWERQRLLEIQEGLAEYSGMMWAKAPLDYLEDNIQKGMSLSMVRSGAYRIGPAIGLALDAAGLQWRSEVTIDTDLADFFDVPSSSLEEALLRVNYDTVRAEISDVDAEQAVDRQRRAAAFSGPLLKLSIQGLTFDPAAVENSPLGTLYVEARTRDDGIDVAAHDGIVVASDFTTAYVACPEQPCDGAKKLEGPGWTATFARGWETRAKWIENPSAAYCEGSG